jgi:hypothetical protein
MADGEVINGYDLCSRVLARSDNDAGALVHLAGGTETDWLEFKAACEPPPEGSENGTNADDYRWHVARAIVAMTNTHGGCVLLGVNDQGRAVGLGPSDPRGKLQSEGMDGFLRHLDASVLRPKNGWKCMKAGNIEVDGGAPHDIIELLPAFLEGRSILAILVRPRSAGAKCLHCIEAIGNRDRALVSVRDLGHVGRVRDLVRHCEISDWERNRQPLQSRFGDYLKIFHDSLNLPTPGGAPAGLEDRIVAYHSGLQRKLEDIERAFVELDAEERTDLDISDEAFQPWAEEYLTDDTGWEADGYDDEEGLEETEKDGGSDDDIEQDIRIARRGGVFDLLEDEPRAVLLGEPGGGKTTCLKRLALRAASAYGVGGKVVVFAPLSRYQRPRDLWPLVMRSTMFGSEGGCLSEEDLDWLQHSGRLRLLLDALNECPETLRPACQDEIRNLLLEHPDLPVVISARSTGWAGSLRLPAFTVQPMGEAQCANFLRKMLADPTIAEQLLERLNELGTEALTLGNPLLLRMAVEVFRRDHDLPVTRALLYRRVIGLWYHREAKKARRAREPLPWDENTVRNALAKLAFIGRKAGVRILARPFAECVLRSQLGDPARFLERLGQGFLFRCEANEMDFSHESYQEYFAAEFWLANPEAVDPKRFSNIARWGMVIVHAAQLGKPPEYICSAAWRMDPWLGTALAPRHPIPQCAVATTMSWEKSVRDLLDKMNTGQVSGVLISNKHLGLYSRSNSVLSGAVLSVAEASQRWKICEISILKSLTGSVGASHFLLNSIHAPKTLMAAIALEPSGDKKAELLRNSWIRTANPIIAKRLVLAEVITASQFEPRINAWVNKATPAQAIAWIKTDFFTPSDFEPRKYALINSATPDQVLNLINAGILFVPNFEPLKQEWICNVNLWLRDCIQNSDSDQLMHEWRTNAANWQTDVLVKTGIIDAPDLDSPKRDWIAMATLEQAVVLVRAGIFVTADFNLRKQEWMKSASPEQVAAWIQSGICTREDYNERVKEWVEASSSLDELFEILLMGATERDRAKLVRVGILPMDPHSNIVTPKKASHPNDLTLVEDDSAPLMAPAFENAEALIEAAVTGKSGQQDLPLPSLPEDLFDELCRLETEEFISGKTFLGTVVHTNVGYAFIETDSIPCWVFCHHTSWPSEALTNGMVVRFRVRLRFNEKQNLWSYSASAVKLLSPIVQAAIG